MILSATLSKPVSNITDFLDKEYIKIKITIENSSNGTAYFAQMFTKTQVFHKHFTEQELVDFLEKHAGKTFKNCVKRTETQEITILANKKGKITELAKTINQNGGNGFKNKIIGSSPIMTQASPIMTQSGSMITQSGPMITQSGSMITQSGPIITQSSSMITQSGPIITQSGSMITQAGSMITQSGSMMTRLGAKKKNYLISEGTAVPFLILLGVMTSEGKVVSSKYDKFRQINRFLEFIDDILPSIYNGEKIKNKKPLNIIDFGCGKSYLTFAVHYYLTQIKNIPCNIEGLDLKQDVIDYCNDIVKKLNLSGLVFHKGNISDYSGTTSPDLIITLHACDTATDYALKYAVERNAKAILSVPCCQHQINQQLQNQTLQDTVFEPLLQWGIIREKFSSLVTDALRGEWLQKQGYKVQMLEFIDMEHTPKNILIRAVKKSQSDKTDVQAPKLINSLSISPEIWKE